MTQYRWSIVALLFFATTINYLDRQVISLLKEDYLDKQFGWTEQDYANIVIAFQIAYAIGLLLAGGIIDRVGTKIGYAASIVLWSIAAILHGFVGNTAGFIAVRGFLGVSEAGNFPAAIKTVAEWFPKKERALATGIFNTGSNIGAVFAPLMVPVIAVMFSWEMAFILTGAVGFVWLFFWWAMYRKPETHPKVNAAELAHINSDEAEVANAQSDEKPFRWFRLLRFRQTWAFVIGKLLTDPIWWFYLFWLPSFLKNEYGLTKTQLSLPLATVYLLAAIGSVMGGWLSGYFIERKGIAPFYARRRTLLIFAFFALPVLFSQALGSLNMWLAIFIIGIATAGHQGFSANIFTTVSDMFPKKAVASVTGIGGMAGAIGGILIASLAGLLFDHYKALGSIQTGYYIMFVVCSLAYLMAWLIMRALTPRFERIEI
ncbi:MAG: MFS transporter [Saprospiraceae bacterium]|nr:MFS transporter [Saprospiraceae bacterium]